MLFDRRAATWLALGGMVTLTGCGDGSAIDGGTPGAADAAVDAPMEMDGAGGTSAADAAVDAPKEAGGSGGTAAVDAEVDALDEKDGAGGTSPSDGSADGTVQEGGGGADSSDDGPCACTSSADCDDGNECNGSETCEACTCVAGVPKDDGTPCDDGDICTDGDVCTSGACVPGANSCVCQTDDDCLVYDDGDLCNGRFECVGSQCKTDPGTVVTCDSAGNTDCLVARCDPATGQCSMVPEGDGSACDDGNGCTSGESCLAGACAGGSSTCQCAVDADCAPLEDGDPCNGTLRCVGNACAIDPATVVSCPAGADTTCAANRCNPASGLCAMTPVLDGTTCDDGSVCTMGDACSSGVCGGASVSCDDGNSCTTDSCDSTTGCKHGFNAVACDDGDPCTDPDTCGGGSCHGVATGLTNCGGACVDAQTDANHCGGCAVQCAADEMCAAGSCKVRSWDTIGGGPVNKLAGAVAHALSSDGTTPHVAWVADESPQDAVYVHRLAANAWSQLGPRLTDGIEQVQAAVDLQFNGATPVVLHSEGGPLHVRVWSGATWNEVGVPGHTASCAWRNHVALALQGATPHLSYVGAGGCGIGVGYTYLDSGTSTWWKSPAPPSPMPGLLTMFGGMAGFTDDVVHDGARALVALVEYASNPGSESSISVRTWNANPAPGQWDRIGGDLNLAPMGMNDNNALWMTIGADGQPWVAWSEMEMVGGSRASAVFVKRYNPATSSWVLVGGGRASLAGQNTFQPSLAFVGQVAYLAYVESDAAMTTGVVKVRRFGGAVWERAGLPLNNDLTAADRQPCLASIGGMPYVAFREPVAGTARILVKRLSP